MSPRRTEIGQRKRFERLRNMHDGPMARQLDAMRFLAVSREKNAVKNGRKKRPGTAGTRNVGVGGTGRRVTLQSFTVTIPR